jgi:hypothetical protein
MLQATSGRNIPCLLWGFCRNSLLNEQGILKREQGMILLEQGISLEQQGNSRFQVHLTGHPGQPRHVAPTRIPQTAKSLEDCDSPP